MDTGSEKLTDRNPPEMSFTNTKNRYLVVVALMIWFIPKMDAQTFVPFKQRLANGGVNLKGDITFIANSIVSKNQDGTVPNDNYNGSESNNRLNLDYIDVDNDNTTFSSSKAQLAIPSCSKVVYAGLYWSAVYPRKYWNDVNSTRDTEVNTIKFKLPNQEYQHVTGDVIFDGPTISGTREKIVYTVYKDVTDIITSLNDPNGDYYAANIKATVRGSSNTGSSAGWILVVIYENQSEPTRRISIFDGFTAVKGGSNSVNAEVSYSGFKTIPVGPVRAKLLVAALEGDKSIRGDRFQIMDVNGNFQSLSTPNTNPVGNFFNGSITLNDAYLPNRNPASQNTLGFDADLFDLNNINNQLIANNQEDAEIRLTTSGDGYWVFLNAMSVEIIEPDIELIKTIEDVNGNDIAGQDVTLGNEIWYTLNFRNKGNDNAIDTQIIDRLPKNVDLLETEITVPNGVTYTYQAPTLANSFRGELVFSIPDNLVEKGDPTYEIRLKVKVVESCNELRDVCSYIIQNQAFVDFTGEINGIRVENTPSYFGLDACNIGYEGPSNFLVDVENCTYEREEVLCTDSVELSAGEGFLSYTWKNSNGDVIGTTQTITVGQTGRYTVDKVAPVGCIGSQEIINVVSFITQPNPIIDFADETKTCPDDGSILSEIYLCGTGSSKLIETSIYNSNTLIWQKLDENSCTNDADEDCPNTNSSCTWNTVKTGNDFTANEAGRFRLEIRAQGGCFKRYYFDVYQANLDPLISQEDIVCGTPGSITVDNISSDYQFSLTNDINTFQDSNSFSVTTPGSYTVYIRKKGGSATSCVYEVPGIDILEKNIEVDLLSDPILCSSDDGIIRAQVKNVPGDYIYELFKGGQLLSQTAPKSDNDHTFQVSVSGTYTVKVTAPNSCSFEGTIDIVKPESIILSAVTTKNISCSDGTIQLTASGGTPNFNYAIWSYNGTALYTNVTDIPIDKFFTSNTFTIPTGEAGTYEFVVVDQNNCSSISNPVVIEQEPGFTFTQTTQNISCNGGTDGSFSLTPNESLLGYTLIYSINSGIDFQSENTFNGLAAGNYTVLVRATKGIDVCDYLEDITITEPDAITGTATLSQELTCSNDGIISFSSVSGGTAPYKYSLDGINFFDSTSFENLTAGTYTPTIRDANNCELNLGPITIGALPTAPEFTTNITYDCNGIASIEVLPTNSDFSYSLNGGTAVSTNVFNNLTPGDYQIEINIGKECTELINASILSSQAFTGLITNYQNPTCFGSSDGSIVITSENFQNDYQYSINNGAWVTATTSPVDLSNLAAGNYGIRLQKDSCIVDLGTISLTEPDALLLTATVENELSCTNSTTNISTSVTGGTPPYEFSLDNGTTWQNTLTNLSVGTYTIQTRDSQGCATQTDTVITINQPEDLQINTSVTNCFTGSNGEISIQVLNGNGNYVFSLNDGPWQSPNTVTPNSYTFENLIANTYKIAVRDGLNCEVIEENLTINPELTASIISEDINCTNGSVAVTASGGDSNFIYAFIPSGNTVKNSDFSSSNTSAITSAGNYVAYVRDKNGGPDFCEIQLPFTINLITNVSISSNEIQPNCFNETGGIELTFQDGVQPYSIAISGPNGYSNTSSNLYISSLDVYNLEAGNYTITITDANGCQDDISAEIINPLELTASLSPILPDCDVTDYSLFGVEFSTSTNYSPYNIEYSIDNGTSWSSSTTFMNIAPGTVLNPKVRLLELDGVTQRCVADLDNFRMPFHVSNLLVSTSSSGNCADGFEVTVEAQDGVPPYQFAINSPTNWQSPAIINSTTYVFNNLTPGLSYKFYVRDSSGCIKENSEDVYELFTPDVIVSGSVDNDACATSDNGSATFTINDPSNNISGTLAWNLYNASSNIIVRNGSQNNTNDIQISNLPSGDYYLTISNNSCSWGSSTITIERGLDINGDVAVILPITCSQNGIIGISNMTGGFGDFTYTLTSSNFQNPITTQDSYVEIPISSLIDDSISSTINVSVVDSNSCPKDLGNLTISVSEKPEIQSIDTNSCSSNKTITVQGTKGVTPYLYSINNGANYQTGNLFENLVAGTYTVKIMDANGCESPSQDVIIYEDLQFEATITKNLDCSVNPNAEIDIEVTAGSSNYDIEVLDASNNSVISRRNLTGNQETIGLSASGTFTLNIFDNTTNCFKSISIQIDDSIQPLFRYDITNSTCSGGNSGIIALNNLSNGIDYTYSISPNNGTFDASSNSFINLPPGTYEITASGDNSCTTIQSNITIQEFDPIIVPTPIVTEFACQVGNINSTASISIDTASITGGSGSYSIIEFIDNKGTETTADDSVVQSGSNPKYYHTDVNGGNFTINVYDDSGCSGTVNAIINPFVALTNIIINETKPMDCATGASVTIDTNSEVQSLVRTFILTYPNGSTTTNNDGIFTDLDVGNYSIQVTVDATGCYLEDSFEISDPNNFEIEVTKLNEATCFNSNSGAVQFQFNSTTPFTGNYNWSLIDATTDLPVGINGSGSGQSTINGIPAGEYYVRTTQVDSPYCEVTSPNFSIQNPPSALDFTFTETLINCDNSSSGSVTINATGGWSGYEYSLRTTSGTVIQSFGTNNIINGLSANDYIISVQDQLGCVIEKPFALTAPTDISADIVITPLLCNGASNATIEILNVTGGQGNPAEYRYQIQSGTGLLSVKQQGNSFSNLSAGTYTIVVSDEFNCSTSFPVIIDDPSEVTVTANIATNISCSSSTATVTVAANGGSGSYEYSLDGNNYSINNSFNLPAGSYQFYARDTNGCISQASTIIDIEPLIPLTATLNTEAAQINCSGDSTAVLSAIASGGFGNYEYELLDNNDVILTNRQSSNRFEDLGPGTYKIKVYSADCEFITNSYTITEPAPLVMTNPIQVSNISCFGNNDGSIIVNASGGTGSLQYSIDQTKYQDSNVFQNLAPGTYDVTVQDEQGCFIVESVTINEPQELSAIAVNIQQELCANDGNAGFELQITGGTAPYKTSLNGGNYVENQLSFSNLNGGSTYVVFVQDAQGCEDFVVVRLDSPVTIDLSTTTSISCDNYLSTISASVNTDVQNDVQYSLNNVDYTSNPIFDNLQTGTYTVYARHTNGCIVSEEVTIANPSPISIDSLTPSNISCFGANNGSITINATGGQGTLQYSLNGTDYQSGNTFENLTPGIYQVYVKDELNCSITSTETTITEPTQLVVQPTIVNAESCLNQNDASIEFAISGGTAPYSSKINDGAFIPDNLMFNNLSGGTTYTITIQDAQGCTATIQVTPDPGVSINLTTSFDVNCTTYLSTITAEVNESIKDQVQYSLNNVDYTSNPIFENLQSGTYTIYARHSNGCVVSENITIANPSPISIDSLTPNNVSCFGSNNGSISINATGGQGTLQFSLNGTDYQSGNTFENLSPGAYQVYVKDELNCTIQRDEILITEPSELQVTATNIQDVLCFEDAKGGFSIEINGGDAPYQVQLNNGQFIENQFTFTDLTGGQEYRVTVRDANNCKRTINVNLNAGVNLDLTLEPEYSCTNNAVIFALVDDQYEGQVTYTINGQNPQRDGIFTNVTAGDYTVEAKHDNGCTSQQTITIKENPALQLSIDTSTENKLIANVSGGFPPYEYSLDGINFTSSNEFNITETKLYTITARDSRGCLISVEVMGEYIDIVIPNFFTPNGNGKHDCWYPKKVNDYHNIEVQIYDRYSRLIRVFKGVDNCWDGLFNGRPLPSGDYWYVIYYNQTPTYRKKLMGNFTLYR